MKDGVSRQRRWQIAQHAKGRCERCGQVLNLYKRHCDICAAKHCAATRKYRGSKPWQQGRPGRPPLNRKPPEKNHEEN
jgi:hypothetical protein